MRIVSGSAIPWYGTGKGAWLLAALAASGLAVVAHSNGLSGEFVLDDRLFLAALLTSEAAVAYPLLILALEWIRNGRPRALRAAPYLVVLAVYFVIRNAVLGATIPLDFTNQNAWLRFPVFVTEYLRHLVLPYPQPLFLAMPPEWNVSPASGLAAGFLAVLFAVLLGRRGKDRQGPLLAAAWLIGALLPPLAASFHPSPFFVLRSLYLPSAGISILVAWLADRSDFMRRRTVLAALAACALLPLGLTIEANRGWQNDGRVSRRAIDSNPEDHAGYIGLGNYLRRTGDTPGAIRAYEKAAAVAGPGEKVTILEALALMLGQSGESERSLEIYRQVTRLEPDRSSAWVGVGNNLWYLGRQPEAVDAFRKAHAADPANRQACYNLVVVLKTIGRPAEAARYAACAAGGP